MQGVSEPASQRGVIPRAFEHIFESIQVSFATWIRPSYKIISCKMCKGLSMWITFVLLVQCAYFLQFDVYVLVQACLSFVCSDWCYICTYVCMCMYKLVCRKYKIPGEGLLLGDLQWRNPRPFGKRHQTETRGKSLEALINKTSYTVQHFMPNRLFCFVMINDYETSFSDSEHGAHVMCTILYRLLGWFKTTVVTRVLEGQRVWARFWLCVCYCAAD